MGDVHPLNELKLKLARELVALTFGRWNKSEGRVVFACSGAEAVEVALKTAERSTPNDLGVIAFEGAYHGLTYGALSIRRGARIFGLFFKAAWSLHCACSVRAFAGGCEYSGFRRGHYGADSGARRDRGSV